MIGPLLDAHLPFFGTQAGRVDDWFNKETNRPADGDKVFAANVGIEFKVPEDIFG